jgi:D-glycero-beta-D-manno-heptose-7-phosphate kinase
MKQQRLESILEYLPELRIIVLGDYVLDRSLIVDPALAQTSQETGHQTYQVFDERCSLGAAGSVAATLRSLGVTVIAMGVIGDDGGGFDVTRLLRQAGIDTSELMSAPGFHTPTIIRTVVTAETGSAHQLSRADVGNCLVMPPGIEQRLAARLRLRVAGAHAIVVVDQVIASNTGLVTDGMRDEIARLAGAHPHTAFLVDSRQRIGLFRNVAIKPNEQEATHALHPAATENLAHDDLIACARELCRRCGRQVFLTAGEQGIFLVDDTSVSHIPAVPVSGPVDAQGAGDSALAGIAAALAAGASPFEAAELGVLAASVTLQRGSAEGILTRAMVRAAASSPRQ